MEDRYPESVIFFTCVRTIGQRSDARLLIDSMRSFGGEMSENPIWVFEVDPQNIPCGSLAGEGVKILPLEVPQSVGSYYYGAKVYACARAEELAPAEVGTLVWLSPENLIIQPPLLFDLGELYDVAVRPVHIKNVGSPVNEPPDEFWTKVYNAVGVRDMGTAVETFIDPQMIRAYFNSAAYAFRPSVGLGQRWFEMFELLVNDSQFQDGPCRDDWHQVFLHQAVLSTLIASQLDPDRIMTLPPDYIYPYNLHQDVPLDRRAGSLNDLVCIFHEGRSLVPDDINDIGVEEPLRSWLANRSGDMSG